ncbi:hypothetical protein SAMN02910298_00329 [Pseudobutyrivibrio sp. YE44]|uniref:hypothetical protein n=1 Tax=Pseudobutyrivibrio sp. YE44 TaxID=1520802 RepID=UPI000888605D|nr:hypothetical protein [Pseudobutyrivibrio sp. YE44]SDB08376.1 hypothetical protein SAMN02910298_00329 [Pseudobutyrivibrio sp. YE44]
MAKYNIGGYIFNDENSAKKAAKELKAVEYILGQVKGADENGVLQVYKKILKQRLFSTEIGMSFLNQLRQNLVASGAFDESDIPPVYTIEEERPAETAKPSAPIAESVQAVEEKPETKNIETSEKKASKTKEKKQKTDKSNVASDDANGELKKLRLINRFLIVCVITLLLCIGGMFYISTTINSPTILNYKESITDEYSTWKEELDQREKDLNEREEKLTKQELGVSDIE